MGIPVGSKVEVRPVLPSHKFKAFGATVTGNKHIRVTDGQETGWYAVVDAEGQEHDAHFAVVFVI